MATVIKLATPPTDPVMYRRRLVDTLAATLRPRPAFAYVIHGRTPQGLPKISQHPLRYKPGSPLVRMHAGVSQVLKAHEVPKSLRPRLLIALGLPGHGGGRPKGS